MTRFLHLIYLLRLLNVESLPDCKFKLLDETCEQNIAWKARNKDEALGICMEHFATTYIEARYTTDTVTCTVSPLHICSDPDAVLIFDKCFKFETTEKKLKDVNCEKPVPFTSRYIKHIGKAAATKGIKKVWMGITSSGQMLKSTGENKDAIAAQLWKVTDEGEIWNGDKRGQKDPAVDAFVFYRTRTDFVNYKQQGGFEYADEDATATHACETDVFLNGDQEWYCNKMRSLKIDTVYDKKKRTCLYLTTLQYNMKTEIEAQNIQGCRENPFTGVHTAGVDDGTGTPATYAKLNNKGPARLSGFAVTSVYNKGFEFSMYADRLITKCESATDDARGYARLKWKLIDHNREWKQPFESALPWENNAPANECSKFSGESTTMAIREGKLLDVPPELRAQAVCSIKMFRQCEIDKARSTPSCPRMQECHNDAIYHRHSQTTPGRRDGFFTCSCPDHHTMETDGTCKWMGAVGCAYLYLWNSNNVNGTESPVEILHSVTGRGPKLQDSNPGHEEKLFKVSVHENCHFSVGGLRSDKYSHRHNRWSLDNAGYGTHQVPNHLTKTYATNFLSQNTVACWCT